MRSRIRITLLSLCLLQLCACATLPPGAKRDPRDPWERVNRTTYKFNDALDRAVLKPAAVGYTRVLPQPVRTGVNNFFTNLGYPVVIVNDLLQWQIRPFFSDIGRLLLNTTLGLGGFLDPATPAGLEKNDRDLGQTFGKWGIPAGPYLMVPLLGPYTVRDGAGAVGDDWANPRHYISFWTATGLYVVSEVDTRSRLLPAEGAIRSAYDPYAFIRNAYLQHRDFKVHGERPSNEEEEEQKLMEEIGESESGKPSPAPPPAAPQGKPQPPTAAPPETQPPETPPPSQLPPSTPPQSPPSTPPQSEPH